MSAAAILILTTSPATASGVKPESLSGPVTAAWSQPLSVAQTPVVSPDGDVAINECPPATGDVPIYQQFTAGGQVRFALNGPNGPQPACPTPTVFDAAGNSYVAMYDFDPNTNVSTASINSYTPQGAVRWSTPLGMDADIQGMTLGYDGNLWAIYGISDVLSVNAATGRNLSAPAFTTLQANGEISADRSGLVIAGADYGASGVSYYSYAGDILRLVREDAMMSYPASVAIGANGVAYISGCNPAGQQLVMEATLDSGEGWVWTVPDSDQLQAPAGECWASDITPTPDGGLVAGFDADFSPAESVVYFGLRGDGTLRWTHEATVPQGEPDNEYIWPQPVVDANGDVVLPSAYQYSDPSCENSTCEVTRVDFVDQATGAEILPSLDESVGTVNTYYGVGVGRLFAATVSATGQSLIAYNIPGMGGDYLQSLQPGYGAPTIAKAQILSPSLSDHLLARRLKITPSTSAPGATFQYGWLPPGTHGSSPTVGIQGCANTAGACTVSYKATTPSQTGWSLFVRAKSRAGAGPWVRAVDQVGSSNITIPSKPVLVALGDSITSGHHRLGDNNGTTCNDGAYGYPNYVWRALQVALPSQWRSTTGYYNFARSGFSTANILEGGKDACHQLFTGKRRPIAQAMNVLKQNADGWARVVITAGIDDTNWGDVLENIAVRSLSGKLPSYGKKSCQSALRGWDGKSGSELVVKDLKSNVALIIRDLRSSAADPAAQIDWLGYYNIAPKRRGHPPVPVSCSVPFEKAVTLLNGYIQSALASFSYSWVDTGVMNRNSALMQSWLLTDAPAMLAKLTSPGWPHPNESGAKAIGALVNVYTGTKV